MSFTKKPQAKSRVARGRVKLTILGCFVEHVDVTVKLPLFAISYVAIMCIFSFIKTLKLSVDLSGCKKQMATTNMIFRSVYDE